MINNLFIKVLLAPFSLLYGLIIGTRNLLYDAGLLKPANFNLPIINVGNLSIGGAGKTPHVEYIIRLLKDHTNVSVLSRGYKRKTKGFRFVDGNQNVLETGDEPLQYKRKYKNLVVAVSESRALGIPEIIKRYPKTEVVLLDDAFQHRAVNPGLNILLTEFERPYSSDILLPSGRLRESKKAADRADIVIVTKCPAEFDDHNNNEWRLKLSLRTNQSLYFSKYIYFNPYGFFTGSPISLASKREIILISAIASTTYLKRYLDSFSISINHLEYEDHHNFLDKDIDYIEKVYSENKSTNLIILTTEKDAMRLSIHYDRLKKIGLPLFVLPIEVAFANNDKSKFDKEIQDFLLNFRV